MIRILWMVFVCTVLSGCVATTQIIIKHQLPEKHIQYEINQGWTNKF